jgi:hypothetical protein
MDLAELAHEVMDNHHGSAAAAGPILEEDKGAGSASTPA